MDIPLDSIAPNHPLINQFWLNGTGPTLSSYTIWVLRQVGGWGSRFPPPSHSYHNCIPRGSGDDGTDLLLGGPLNDDLWGGEGHDTLTGGTGNDDFYDPQGPGEVSDASSVDRGFNVLNSEGRDTTLGGVGG